MIDFQTIVDIHRIRYPLMQPQDYGKLAFQSAMGPEHMVSNEQAVVAYILQEWQMPDISAVPCNPEPIGQPICRYHLTVGGCSPDAAVVLAKLFIQSAKGHTGTWKTLHVMLNILEHQSVQGIQAWVAAYRRRGCPPVHHSEVFRNAYHPHYRILLTPLAEQVPALLGIRRSAQSGQPVTVSLHGYTDHDAAAFFSLLPDIISRNTITAVDHSRNNRIVKIVPNASATEETPALPTENKPCIQRFQIAENRSITLNTLPGMQL